MVDAARQQMKSCDNCRKRKVKCDSRSRGQCSACAKAKITCKFDLGWRRRRKQAQTPEVVESVPENSIDVTRGRVQQDRRASETHGSRGDESGDGLPTELTASLHWAQNSLYRFFKEGVSTSRSNWTAFNPVDQVRTAYVGSHLSNLTHLIELASNCPPSFIIYAYPDIHDHTRRKASPIPGPSPNDRLKSVESFPSMEIRNNLIEAFFTKIHPFFPIIDESDFRQRYFAIKAKVPVLLLHAVLLVGARVTDHPRVVRSRETVMAVLFSRAKKAFDMRDENDRMHLVQAALLFSWHLQDGDNVAGNSWYWIGVACRIALGLGMHRNVIRDPVDANRMPLSDRRTWRRIWWALYQMEVMSALEHGRPSMIRVGDYDQEPLSKEDLIEANGELNTKVDFDCSSRGIALCEIALTISCLSAPGFTQIGQHRIEEDIKSLKQRLVAWMLANGDSEPSNTFGPLHLMLRYDTIVLHLNRMVDDAHFDRQSDHGSNIVEAAKVSSASALSIIATLEKVHANDMLSQCDFTVVTALSAAAIQISKDLRHAIEVSNLMLAISERQLLVRACAVAEQLSRLWPNAEGVRKVFKSILDSMVDGFETNETITINTSAARQDSANDASDLEPSAYDVDWTDIMAFESLAAEDIDWNGSLFGFEQNTT